MGHNKSKLGGHPGYAPAAYGAGGYTTPPPPGIPPAHLPPHPDYQAQYSQYPGPYPGQQAPHQYHLGPPKLPPNNNPPNLPPHQLPPPQKVDGAPAAGPGTNFGGKPPPVVAKDHEHARLLDAADGKGLNGTYFGAPILSAKPMTNPGDTSMMSSDEKLPAKAKDTWRRDPYGYDFPMLEEVVKVSDHGRQLTDAELAEAIKKRAKAAEADDKRAPLTHGREYGQDPHHDEHYDYDESDYSDDDDRAYDFQRDLEVSRLKREAQRPRRHYSDQHYDRSYDDRYDGPYDGPYDEREAYGQRHGGYYGGHYDQPYDDRVAAYNLPYDNRPAAYDRPAYSRYEQEYDSRGGRY